MSTDIVADHLLKAKELILPQADRWGGIRHFVSRNSHKMVLYSFVNTGCDPDEVIEIVVQDVSEQDAMSLVDGSCFTAPNSGDLIRKMITCTEIARGQEHTSLLSIELEMAGKVLKLRRSSDHPYSESFEFSVKEL
jgi:hypothetical protein